MHSRAEASFSCTVECYHTTADGHAVCDTSAVMADVKASIYQPLRAEPEREWSLEGQPRITYLGKRYCGPASWSTRQSGSANTPRETIS